MSLEEIDFRIQFAQDTISVVGRLTSPDAWEMYLYSELRMDAEARLEALMTERKQRGHL